MPLCGDDQDALAAVAALVRESGADPLEGGGLERAALLEAATAVAAGVWTQGRQPGEVFGPVRG